MGVSVCMPTLNAVRYSQRTKYMDCRRTADTSHSDTLPSYPTDQ